MIRARRGFSLIEVLVGMGLLVVISGIAYGLMRFGIVSIGTTVTPQIGLQTASRKAMVDFIREIQESIEIARPVPGTTLSYFVARDKTNCVLTVFSVKNAADSAAAGKDIFDVYLNRKRFTQPDEQRRLLSRVERLAFTSLSPGLLQIHLDLFEGGKTYSLLTAVRTRNILAEGRL